jgi:hypothetical protein
MGRAARPDATEHGLPEHVQCPFCGGMETELHSPFGPQLSVATYWCRPCHSAFDWIKWTGRPPRLSTDD